VRPRLLCLGLGALLIVACGDDDPAADDRAAQVRDAADDAGLDAEVADLLVLASEGLSSTYQVTYAGTDGAEVVVSQDPPNRRVDVVTAGLIVQSQVVRDGVAYRCDLPEGGSPGDPLVCERTQGALTAPGPFTDDALEAFTTALLDSADDVDLTVDERVLADIDARCLVSAPKAGTPLDGSGPGVETLCLSPEGAQLLIDSGGERLVADGYSTTVPEGTFDVTAG
jgi:hypothetical protein